MQAQWKGPPAEAPIDNVPAPLNVGSSTQVKTGNLRVNVMEAATEMRSNRYCDSLGNNCFLLPLNSSSTSAGGGIGYNQVWQEVNRAQGVWYQNNTAQPIMLFHKNIWNGSNISIGVSQANYVNLNSHDYDSDLDNGLSVIVPPGHYYRMNSPTQNSGEGYYVYLELRNGGLGPYCDVNFSWNINGQTGTRIHRVYGVGQAAIAMNYDKDDWEWQPVLTINDYTKIIAEHGWGGSMFDSAERGRVGFFDGSSYSSKKSIIDGYNSHQHIVTTSLPLVAGTSKTITNKAVSDIGAGSIRLTATVGTCGQ